MRAALACVAVCAALLAAAPAQATFPGPNGRLVFTSGGLVSVRADGSGVFQVLQGSLGDPAWSPDARQIAFSSAGIVVVNADGSGRRQVTTNGSDIYPAWSPDGRRLVFARGADLFVIGVDGSGETNLTGGFPRTLGDPEWSPDGTRIAADDGFDIYVMGADGASPTIIAQGGRYPSWAPDGSRIAYSARTAVNLVAPDGSGNAPLVSGLREVWEVVWSPDGSRIGFAHDDGGPAQEQVWTVNADGSGAGPLIANRSGTTLDWGTGGEPGTGGAGGGGGIGSTTEPPAPPVAGESVVVREIRGQVTVRLPAARRAAGLAAGGPFAGTSQAGFVPLTGAANIPVGAIVNAARGTVRLTAEQAPGTGQLREVDASAGQFQINQARSRRPVTELSLNGGSFRRLCGRAKPARAAGSARRVRRLRVNGRGRFRTRGRYSTTVVRGTDWDTIDRCDGTLTRVRVGVVTVRDLVRRRTIRVAAGRSYLAARRR